MTYIGSGIATSQFLNDTFSGNGTTTAFSLSIAPANVNAILVTVGTTFIAPSLYSLNGATLNFTTAPATGTSNINVRHLGTPGLPFSAQNSSVGINQLSATGNASSQTYLQGDNTWSPVAIGANRIINGHMYLDQRNNGASLTPNTSGQYCLDRWATFGSQPSKFSVQQSSSSSVPGFIYYLAGSSNSAYTIGANEVFGISQVIEGFNIADLGFGNPGAKSCTLSFWARASQTGRYGIFLKNGGVNVSGYGNFFYVTSYTITTANTWQQIVININAPTTGQWEGTNGAGLCIVWSYGAGSAISGGTQNAWSATFNAQPAGCVNLVATNGATLHITGVDFRVGTFTTAPQWDMRSFTLEQQLCFRYFQLLGYASTAWCTSGTTADFGINYLRKRDAPTIVTSGSPFVRYGPGGQLTPTIAYQNIGVDSAYATATIASGFATNASAVVVGGYQVASEL